MSVVKEFVNVIKSADKKGTKPYDTQATVTRVEGNTAWVHIPGGVDETPIKMTISAKAGDTVQVRVSGGTAWMTGNASAPPTDDTQAIKANDTAVKATKKAEKATQQAEVAKSVADSAKQVAEATNQHFWQRSTDPNSDGAGTGAFVTDEEQDTFLDAMLHDVQPTTQRPLHNLLMNAEGILLRAAKRIRAAFTPSGVAFYDGQGNNASNIVAAFGTSGAQIGKSNNSHLLLEPKRLQLVDNSGNVYMDVRDLRDSNGQYSAQDNFVGDGSSRVFLLTFTSVVSITSVTINGTATTAYTNDGTNWLEFTTPPANNAVIIVEYVTADSKAKAFTFGSRESGTVDYGGISVVSGQRCKASGSISAAFGLDTEAQYVHQFVLGRYNNNSNKNVFEIGNGRSAARSNAFSIDWSGNVEAAGTIKSGGTAVSLQGHTHGLKFTNILTQRSITTTATNYNCAWSDYDALILCSMFYGNVRETIVVPVDAYFKNCNSGSRPILYDSNNDTTYEIFPASNTQVTIIANNALGANYGVNIYGVKIE